MRFILTELLDELFFIRSTPVLVPLIRNKNDRRTLDLAVFYSVDWLYISNGQRQTEDSAYTLHLQVGIDLFQGPHFPLHHGIRVAVRKGFKVLKNSKYLTCKELGLSISEHFVGA